MKKALMFFVPALIIAPLLIILGGQVVGATGETSRGDTGPITGENQPLAWVLSGYVKNIVNNFFGIDLENNYLKSNSAKIAPSAFVGKGSLFLNNVNIRKNVLANEDSIFLPNSEMKTNSKLGSWAVLGNKSIIRENSELGDLIFLKKNSQVRENSILGNLVFAGANADIREDSTVGNNVLIGSGAIIGEGSIIGNSVKIGKGAVIPENSVIESFSIIPGLILPESGCEFNPFSPANFTPIPSNFTDSCNVYDNKDQARELVLAWIESMTACRDQAGGIVSELETAMANLEDYVIENYNHEIDYDPDSSAYLDDYCFTDEPDGLVDLPAGQDYDQGFLSGLEICLSQLQNVCANTEKIWSNYAEKCQKIYDDEECGLAGAILARLSYVLPKAYMLENYINEVIYTNSLYSCNVFLETLDQATTCDTSDHPGWTYPTSITDMFDFFKIVDIDL